MDEPFGPWRLVRRIAVGDLADLSEAAPRPGGAAPIVVKRLHAHAAREPAVRALFAREQQVTCTLPPHPALVRGLDAGEVDGRPWLALGLAPGLDLRRRLDAGEAPSPAAARRLVLDLLDALAHVHAHGWLHGDVNPSNLVVADDGAAVLCDLGVCRPPGEPGPVRGTHAYMAPEQARGEPWSPATDVFAAAVILWELRAGRRLFKRDAHWLTLAAVVEDPVPPVGDAALDAVLAAALAKDPAARLPDAATFAAALRAS